MGGPRWKNVDVITKMTNDASFPSNSFASRSCEMPHNMDQSTSNVSYHNVAMLSDYCAPVPSNNVTNNSANNAFIGDGSTASLGYLLDHQHPPVATASYAADQHSTHHGNNILLSLLRASKNRTDVIFRIPGAFILVPSFVTNTDQTIYGAALSEQCDIYSMPGSVGWSSAEFIDGASSFGLTRNLNAHQLGIQSNLRMEPVDDLSLFLQNRQRELFSQQQRISVGNRMPAFNRSQSTLMGSCGVMGSVAQNQIYNRSDQLQLQQNGHQQPHLSIRERKPERDPHQMVLEDHSRANSCSTPNHNQVPMKSGPTHNVTEQFNPSIERCERKKNIASESSETVGGVMGSVAQNQIYNQSDQLQLLQNGHQQPHLSTGERQPERDPHQMVLDHSRANSCSIPNHNQVPMKSGPMHNATEQFNPSIERCERKQNIASESSATVGVVMGSVAQSQIYNQSDQLQLQQNGHQQPHLSMGKRKPEQDPHQMVLEDHSRANNCFIPNHNQVPMKSGPTHNVTEQIRTSIERCEKKQKNISSESNATVGVVMGSVAQNQIYNQSDQLQLQQNGHRQPHLSVGKRKPERDPHQMVLEDHSRANSCFIPNHNQVPMKSGPTHNVTEQIKTSIERCEKKQKNFSSESNATVGGVMGSVAQNQIYNQSDQLQLQQNGHHQPQLSVGKRKPERDPHQMVLEDHTRANSCFIPNHDQVPMKSGPTHNVTEQINPSVERCERKQNIASESSATVGGAGMPRGEVQYVRCHMFFVIYHHALCCTVHERECEYPRCRQMKLLIHHISHCSDDYCKQKGCSDSKKLLTHYRRCRVNTCGICGPTKMRVGNSLQGTLSSNIAEPIASLPTTINTMEQVLPPSNRTERGNANETSKAPLPVKNVLQSFRERASTVGLHKIRVESSSQEIFSSNLTELIASFSTTMNIMEQEQPPLKRIKSDDPILFPTNEGEMYKESVSAKDPVPSFPEGNALECQELSGSVNSSLECMIKIRDPVIAIKIKSHLESSTTSELSNAQVENQGVQVPMEVDKVRLEGNCMDAATLDVQLMETKLPNLKKGGSLIDSFSPKQIKEHMESLREPVCPHEVKETENQESGCVMDMNYCSLCGMKDLHFDPPPRYCAACDIKINPKKICYFMRSNAAESDSQSFFCSVCINVPGDTIKIHNTSILKATLERTKNYAEIFDRRELWVQCHKCKAWQHQICTLFNSIRDKTMKNYHTCPNCILQEIDSGEHKSLLQSKIPGAKDLPTTILSNHIEKRVLRRLEEERHERANSLGKKFSEVPTAEGLVVRVVSSIVKQLEVKPIFRDIFLEGTYPSHFPYKSKAILLFQNIDGADVCLFAMHVQEYGSGCPDPNSRRVCISYIDSVKYFRPEIKTVTGEALRSFVYHGVLEGYFEYCKKRGFTSIYIWACPPVKGGDDYILYSHPKTQKLPKDGKLREWYQKLIWKAEKEKIVAEHSNLYDYFFVKTVECKAKVTAACLPYFDGDYWPGAAEQLLQSQDGNKSQREGTKADDRALRASRRDGLMENPKDFLLMRQLGNIICPIKENFIMVQLWHNCKHCCQPILSEKQLVCNDCKNFRVCEKCFMIQQSLLIEYRHPIHKSQKHSFREVPVDDHPKDIVDDEEENMQSDRVPVDDHLGDIIDDDEKAIQSELFDSRLIFLGHCQKNYYQFDTLRRAKHTTMMILYNLHNQIPTSG